jgi:hypothetical protein
MILKITAFITIVQLTISTTKPHVLLGVALFAVFLVLVTVDRFKFVRNDLCITAYLAIIVVAIAPRLT